MKSQYKIGQIVRFNFQKFGSVSSLSYDLQKYLHGPMKIIDITVAHYGSATFKYRVDYSGHGILIPDIYIMPGNESSTEYED